MTTVTIKRAELNLPITTAFFSVGSCFADESVSWLKKKGVRVLSNPFGTIYNPVSILEVIKHVVGGQLYQESELVETDGQIISLDHATQFDGKNRKQVLLKINNRLDKASKFVKTRPVFIMTLGTAIVWRYKANGRIVANCHRIPPAAFDRSMLSVDEVYDSLASAVTIIRSFNQDAIIICSLSPVRHNPGDLVENMESKSILRVALGLLEKNEKVIYFPSYEIVMDQLRDYSFYKQDGLHLKGSSIEHILTSFTDFVFNGKALSILAEIDKYNAKRKHRVRNRGSSGHFDHLVKFVDDMLHLSSDLDACFIRKNKVIVAVELTRLFSRSRGQDVSYHIERLFAEDRDKDMQQYFRQALLIHGGQYEKVNISDIENCSTAGLKIKKYRDQLLYAFYAATGQHDKCIEHLDPGFDK